jgi:probable F420-dependent oxidoreductase
VDAADLKKHMGCFGAFIGWPTHVPVEEVLSAAMEIEDLGYGAVWCPEAPTFRESLDRSALILAATERIVVATGITSIYTRDATAAHTGAAALAEAYSGRFLLGIACSHPPSVRHRGDAYRPSVAALRAHLDAVDWSAIDAAVTAPRLLGARRPQMTSLAAERTIRAHPLIVRAAPAQRSCETLGPLLLWAPAHTTVVLDDDLSRARIRARAHVANYLQLTNYFERLLGYRDDELAPDSPSPRVVDHLIASRSTQHCAASLAAHLSSGADHVAVMPTNDDHGEAMKLLRALAPALMGSKVTA